jgi:hypothetical protein
MSGTILLAVFVILFAGGITYTMIKGSQTKKITVAVLTGISFLFFLVMVLFAGCIVFYARPGR